MLSPAEAPDVVVVGSAARDIASDDTRGWRLGGGVAFGGLTLARLGLRTGVVVGVDPPAAIADELQLLRAAGGDVRLVRLERSPVFDNVETHTGRVQTCLEPGQPINVDVLPDEFRPVRAWLFAPVADELPEAWAAVPPPGALVAVGWQGLLRELSRGGRTQRRPAQPSSLIARADIVGVSRHDVDPHTPLDALWRLLKPGATLLVTEGVLGGWRLVLGSDGPIERRRFPAISAEREVDPTGAGDVFLAAYLATRVGSALGGSLRHGSDLRLAAAAASLAVEEPGLHGVPELAAVTRRLRESLAPVAHRGA
jgi:sugar/nucleoside kinase (ribokinase family)